MENGITNFLSIVGTNSLDDIITIKNFITRLIKAVLEGFEKDSFWLDIRVTIPNDNWKVPRWHTDGKFYDIQNIDKPNYKFVMAPKGPGTLFSECTNKNIRNKFFEMLKLQGNDYKNLSNRRLNDDLIKNFNIVKCKQNQGAIFMTGNHQFSAIHSEPDFNDSRIFISILPGTKSEILELKDRWDKK